MSKIREFMDYLKSQQGQNANATVNTAGKMADQTRVSTYEPPGSNTGPIAGTEKKKPAGDAGRESVPNKPPRQTGEIASEIAGGEEALNDLKKQATDILREEGIDIETTPPGDPANPKKGPPRRRGLPRSGDFERALEQIAGDPRSPRKAEAQRLLEKIRELRGALGDLNGELGRAQRGGSSQSSGKEKVDPNASPQPADDSGKLDKLERFSEEIVQRKDALSKNAEDLQKRQNASQSQADEPKLQEERGQQLKEVDAIEAEINNAVKEMPGAEGANTEEILNNLQKSPSGSGRLGKIGMKLLAAYTAAVTIKRLLEANTWDERAAIAGETAVSIVVGSFEVELVEWLAGVGAGTATAFVLFFTALDDQPNKPSWEQVEAASQRQKETSKKEFLAARILQKKDPSAVLIREGEVFILKKSAFDATCNWLDDLRARHAGAVASAHQRAYALGEKDGKTGQRAHNQELSKFPELTHLPGGGNVLLPDLFAQYEKGFAVGNKEQQAQSAGTRDGMVGNRVQKDQIVPDAETVDAKDYRENLDVNDAYETSYQQGEKKRDAIFKRARELGATDGGQGKKSQRSEIATWPEVIQMLNAGAATLVGELALEYDKSFREVAMKSARQRAYQLGAQDSKAGAPAHVSEIQTWPAVAEVLAEGPPGQAAFSEVVASYNRGFSDGTKR